MKMIHTLLGYTPPHDIENVECIYFDNRDGRLTGPWRLDFAEKRPAPRSCSPSPSPKRREMGKRPTATPVHAKYDRRSIEEMRMWSPARSRNPSKGGMRKRPPAPAKRKSPTRSRSLSGE